MANLRFELQGKPGDITLDAFVTAVANWQKILAEVDAALSGKSSGSVEWRVSNLSMGSLRVEAESFSKLENHDYGPEVVRASIQGLGILEHEPSIPPYLSESGLKHVRRLLGIIGTNGVTGIYMANHAADATLTKTSLDNMRRALRVRDRSIGSVEGRLDQISVHGKAPVCVVYLHRTHKAVRCQFTSTMLDEVKAALGRRVIAAGIVSYNERHEPVRVALQFLHHLPSSAELPSIETIAGSDPNFTGGLDSVEYVRRMRDG